MQLKATTKEKKGWGAKEDRRGRGRGGFKNTAKEHSIVSAPLSTCSIQVRFDTKPGGRAEAKVVVTVT